MLVLCDLVIFDMLPLLSLLCCDNVLLAGSSDVRRAERVRDDNISQNVLTRRGQSGRWTGWRTIVCERVAVCSARACIDVRECRVLYGGV